MKEQIRNRIAVAEIMTQTALAGKNPAAKFTKKLGSKFLYFNYEKLAINSQNKSCPPARFSRVDLGQGAFVWAPTNKAGELYLSLLNEEDRTAFLYHQPEKSDEPKPESRRVVDGRPIKALPNGRREADYFNASDGTPITPSTKRVKRSASSSAGSHPSHGVTVEPTEQEVADMRAMISAGTF